MFYSPNTRNINSKKRREGHQNAFSVILGEGKFFNENTKKKEFSKSRWIPLPPIDVPAEHNGFQSLGKLLFPNFTYVWGT